MTAPGARSVPEVQTLVELGEASARRFAHRPLFGERDGERWRWMTYAAWQREVDRTRASLASLGVQRGERVAIVSRNSATWAAAAYASFGLGATFVPMYEAQQPSEWEHVLRDSGASLVLGRTREIAAALEAMRGRLPALRHVLSIEGRAGDAGSLASVGAAGPRPVPSCKPSPDAIAALVYTSGTTGLPKGAMLSHGNLTSNVLATLARFPLCPDDRTLSFLPWAHVYGQVCELHLLIAAGASTAFNTHVGRLATDLRSVRPTILVAVPRVFEQMYERVLAQVARMPRFVQRLFWRGHAASLRARRGEALRWRDRLARLGAGIMLRAVRRRFGGRLEFVVSGSATLSRDVADLFDGIGIDVYEGYGLTETSPIVTVNSPGHRKPGSVGLPIPGVRVEIDGSSGARPGEGEIVVHGPNVMKGYHARPDETARVLRADGGLCTGDLGRLDEDGYLLVTGRIKEQYKLDNGRYVMPGPLEQQLALSPCIANVMLHGEGHAYNVALVALDEREVRARLGYQGSSPVGLADDPKVRELVASELARYGHALRAYERPRDFVMTTTPFSIENGLLTPTLKLKRRAALARWGAALEALYPPSLAAAPAPARRLELAPWDLAGPGPSR